MFKITGRYMKKPTHFFTDPINKVKLSFSGFRKKKKQKQKKQVSKKNLRELQYLPLKRILKKGLTTYKTIYKKKGPYEHIRL